MYFVRKYTNGPDYSPLTKLMAVYKCSNCGKEDDIDISRKSHFSENELIKCPVCKSFGKDDFVKGLIAKKEAKEKEIAKIQEEIKNLISEIETAKSKVEINDAISATSN